MTVEKYRKNRLSTIETAWITAVFTGKLTKSLRNVDNASACAAVVDEHSLNTDFQFK